METRLEVLAPKHLKEFSELYRDYVEEMLAYVESSTRADPVSMAQEVFLRYVDTSAHWGYLIQADGQARGFCLLRHYPGEQKTFDMEQFYVAPELRRTGMGQSALMMVLRHFPGEWLIRVLKPNTRALQFWERSLRHACDTLSISLEQDGDLEMVFMRFTTMANDRAG